MMEEINKLFITGMLFKKYELYNQAIDYLKIAAYDHHTEASYQLYIMHCEIDFDTCGIDHDEAIEWLTIAADNGDSNAIEELGNFGHYER